MLVNNNKKTLRTTASLAAIVAACAAFPLPGQAEDLLTRVAAVNRLPVNRPTVAINGARPDISALR